MNPEAGVERLSVLRLDGVLIAAIQQELTDQTALDLQRDLTEMGTVPGTRGVIIEIFAAGFGLVEQTKLVTAASELARNTLVHGGGGEMELVIVGGPGGRGIRLTFTDHGPGIPDVSVALSDGYTAGNGLGLGLSGARRLVQDFTVESTPGGGTTVTVVSWSRAGQRVSR